VIWVKDSELVCGWYLRLRVEKQLQAVKGSYSELPTRKVHQRFARRVLTSIKSLHSIL
jgi:hypothetical protein